MDKRNFLIPIFFDIYLLLLSHTRFQFQAVRHHRHLHPVAVHHRPGSLSFPIVQKHQQKKLIKILSIVQGRLIINMIYFKTFLQKKKHIRTST